MYTWCWISWAILINFCAISIPVSIYCRQKNVVDWLFDECIVWFDKDRNFRITWHRLKFAAWVFYLHLDYTNLSIFASQLCYIISISNVRIIFSLRIIFHFYITCESCEAFTMKLIKQIRIRFVIYFQSLVPTLPNGNVKNEYKQILSITGIICESA